jgi:hypothetical protein
MWPSLHPGDQVTVEPTTADNLHPGDWVLLQGRDTLFLHRFLGFTREGFLLTKGDGHRAPDSPWSPDALRGRAIAISRHGKTIPISSSSLQERTRTLVHRLLAAMWSLAHRSVRRTGPLVLLLLGVSVMTILAAVTLTSFTATPQGDSILIEWETASEVDMFGFYVQRAPYTPDITVCAILPGLNRISNLIPAEGDIIGASYDFTDSSAEIGATYYYCLEAVEVDGDYEFHGPISAGISDEPTTEPSKTPTPTPTPTYAPPPPPPPVTSTSTPTPGPTSTATSTPPTSTPTRTPTHTPTRTPTDTPSVSENDEDTPTQPVPTTSTQVPTVEPTTTIATATPDANPGPQPTGTAALVAQATAISPIASERPKPSPSVAPSEPVPTRSTTDDKGSSFPWGLVPALVVAAGVLILLGGLGLWWVRQKT